MKKKLLKYIKTEIIKQYPNYSNDKISEIMYGIEGLYLTLTKTILIFFVAFILGIWKELLLLLIFFNIIRMFSFGMHANKSWICLIFSSSLFITFTYLCKYLNITRFVLYFIYLLIILIIILYSPADTIKRPLINRKKRIIWKILSIITVFIYFLISVNIKNNLIINCLTFSLIIECILILPITYKIFNMPYNNYKNYGLNITR